MQLKIEKLLWKGKGLARAEDGRAVIIDAGVLPGELVQLDVYKQKKDYFQAKIGKILEPNQHRRSHPCPHHAQGCGGCLFGVLPAKQALQVKHDILQDALQRNLGRLVPDLPAITVISSPQNWRYRFRGQIHVQHGQPHFCAAASNKLIQLQDCLLLHQSLASKLNHLVLNLPDGRHIVACSPDNHQSASELEKIKLPFSLPKQNINFLLSASGFFQANWQLNQVLVSMVVSALQGYTQIVDLYSGSGNFSLPLARQGADILAIESFAPAVKSGQENAALNKLSEPAKFLCANLSKPQTWEKIKKFKPQAAVLDPPRMGSPKLSANLLTIKELTRMAWVSCDVVNTCRDLKPFLQNGWKIQNIALLDMFPQTWHMEILFVIDRDDTNNNQSSN